MTYAEGSLSEDRPETEEAREAGRSELLVGRVERSLLPVREADVAVRGRSSALEAAFRVSDQAQRRCWTRDERS